MVPWSHIMTRLDFVIVPFAMDMAVAMSQIMVNLRALDLGASATEVGVLMGLCWGIAYMLTALTTGRMVARFGARSMILVGGAGFALGLAAYGFATTPWHLLVAAPVAGAGSGVFWPALQTYIRAADPDETRVRSGLFNMSWTAGVLAGVTASGHAYRALGPAASFWSAAGLSAAVLALLAVRLRIGPTAVYDDEDNEAGADRVDPRARSFLHIAWLVNFTMWFAGTSVATVFPRLARSLHFSDGRIGEMAGAVWLGQIGLFCVLTTGAWWHDRKAPFLLGLAAGLVAVLLFASVSTALWLVAASIVIGAARTPGHMASIHYGLHSGGDRDANMGYHEAVLGAGCVLGPLLSGYAADIGGVRAPFMISAALIAPVILAVVIWPMAKFRADRSNPATSP